MVWKFRTVRAESEQFNGENTSQYALPELNTDSFNAGPAACNRREMKTSTTCLHRTGANKSQQSKSFGSSKQRPSMPDAPMGLIVVVSTELHKIDNSCYF